MTAAYLRVSSNKQTTQNQRFEIEEYAKRNGILVDEWVEEVISGTKHHSHRKLGRLIKRLRKDDTLILSELSRLSRNLMGFFPFSMFVWSAGCELSQSRNATNWGIRLKLRYLRSRSRWRRR